MFIIRSLGDTLVSFVSLVTVIGIWLVGPLIALITLVTIIWVTWSDVVLCYLFAVRVQRVPIESDGVTIARSGRGGGVV